jgi:hypothetical protein
MDPYLEGDLWPDVHHNLASVFVELLAPQIAPKYVARVAAYAVEDRKPSTSLQIVYPDIAVLYKNEWKEPSASYEHSLAEISPPNYEIPATYTLKIPFVEIRDRAKNQLITAIEILSPSNKRHPGLEQYRQKRLALHESGVQLLEIDLLRRGKRVIHNPQITKTHYLFSLWRVGSESLSIWTNIIRENLPILPVPLAEDDPDARLPLKLALERIYERGLYQLSIDYGTRPPAPKFEEEEMVWIKAMVNQFYSQKP